MYDKGIHTHMNEKQGFLSDFSQNHVGENKKRLWLNNVGGKK